MALATEELTGLRDAAEVVMLDTCVLGSLTQSGDGWGSSATRTWSYGAAMACGVGRQQSQEVVDGSEATLTDVAIRLPHGTDVTGVSRIQVTHRYGEALAAPEYYAIAGEPHVGVSAVVCQCRRLVGESAR